MSNTKNKCPKFNSCNCPKCPLDEQMKLRVRLPNEDKCPYNSVEINEIKKKAKVSQS